MSSSPFSSTPLPIAPDTAARARSRWWPAPLAVGGRERLRAAGGALVGLMLAGVLAPALLGPAAGALVAPMGATAVLLFALPSSPLAQPWAAFAGNLLSATIGFVLGGWLGGTPIAAAWAASAAILAMFALRCLHPPGGAIAVATALAAPAVRARGLSGALAPVAIETLLMLLAAFVYNNATRHPYPHRAPPAPAGHGTRDAAPGDRTGVTAADLDAAIARRGEVLDIDREDLEALLRAAQHDAYRRRHGETTCADVMSRDLVTAEFGTPLGQAWSMLREHRIKALPVVDRARRVIGIVTVADFLKHSSSDRYPGLGARLRTLLARPGTSHADGPEVVGQIMTARVQVATTDEHVVTLVSALSDLGLHHVPVVDADRRLVGMITQSDLVAALYRDRLDDADGGAPLRPPLRAA